MKVYLSSWFASKDIIKQRANELAAADILVTARWLDEQVKPTVTTKDVSDAYLTETAVLDLEDMLKANVMVLFTPSDADLEQVPKRSWSRGGRNFEAGFFYATQLLFGFLPIRISSRGKRELIICGPREGVFHWLYGLSKRRVDNIELPEIKQFDTWEQVREYLIAKRGS